MAKVNLSDVLARPVQEAPEEDVAPAEPAQPAEPRLAAVLPEKPQPKKVSTAKTARTARTKRGGATEVQPPELQQAPEPQSLPEPALPKYKRLERKEVLLPPELIDWINAEAVRIMRENRGSEAPTRERITANTIVRVAVEKLRASGEELHGINEDDVRASAGL